MKPIALLGGTFDPIHFGHLRTALELIEALNAEKLLLIPNAAPTYRNEPRASFAQRLRMLQLALSSAGNALNPLPLEADDREWIRFQSQGTATFTIDTLRELRALVGRDQPLVWVLGSDQLAALDTWKEWQRLLDFAHLVVIKRPESARVPDHIDAFLRPHRASKSLLAQAPAGYFCAVELSQLAISASKIRELIRNRRAADFLLPQAVLDFIETEQLYREP